MNKFTPGPWLRDGRTIYALNERGVNRFYASVQDSHAPAYELNANAALMQSAPDLLEALEAAMAFIDCHAADPDITSEMCEKYAVLRAANPEATIAKARGQS